MRTRIKICGITRLEDLHAAVAAGADAIGFVFYAKSRRGIGPRQGHELLKHVPPFVTTVGLFVDPERDWVLEVLAACSLDLLQFHGEETAEFCSSFQLPYIKALRMRPGLDVAAVVGGHDGRAQGLLLDAYSAKEAGGTGETFDWSAVPQDLNLPLILAGGLHEENVAQAIAVVKPWAVDVSSGVEMERGVKDAAKISAFVRAVTQASKQ